MLNKGRQDYNCLGYDWPDGLLAFDSWQLVVGEPWWCFLVNRTSLIPATRLMGN